MRFIMRWAFERLLPRAMPEAQKAVFRYELEALLRKANYAKEMAP